MSKKHPEGLRDFPASQPWAGLIDEGPGNATPQKPTPADEKSVKKALINLKKLTGFVPPATTDTPTQTPPSTGPRQENFFDIVPETRAVQPKKITPPWFSDPEPTMGIVTDPHKRRRALGSDARQDAKQLHNQRRKNMGLPEKAPSQKEILNEIARLTTEDIEYLNTLGYNRNREKPYSMLTLEKMLRDLHNHKETM